MASKVNRQFWKRAYLNITDDDIQEAIRNRKQTPVGVAVDRIFEPNFNDFLLSKQLSIESNLWILSGFKIFRTGRYAIWIPRGR